MTPIKKKVLVSVGPMPARLDARTYIMGMQTEKPDLRTALFLNACLGFDAWLICWERLKLGPEIELAFNQGRILRVKGVPEYHGYIAANAGNYDAFVLTADTAGLMPVRHCDNGLPSRSYRPGQVFDIPFMAVPMAAAAIRPRNPKACIINCQCFEETDEGRLAGLAAQMQEGAGADLAFAGNAGNGAQKQAAATADGNLIQTDPEGRLHLIESAIRQQYFTVMTEPLTESEQGDPAIQEALAAVSRQEKSFGEDGAVAMPIKGCPGLMAVTNRNHGGSPVLVRAVKGMSHVVYASGEPARNAPALYKLLERSGWEQMAVHQHFADPMCCKETLERYQASCEGIPLRPDEYVFPGTVSEYEKAKRVDLNGDKDWILPWHGYIGLRPINRTLQP